ncbi:MAG TPA: CGGC domain-containing protein [Candidatus Deferrimicrobium sp.]|nr:CGGC domain-containing protein [Candidatus Deferrimicrobium sp.]
MNEKSAPLDIAIVRCERTQESCPGTSCLTSFQERKHTFQEYGPNTRLVGFFSCGGCPGRRIFRLLRTLKEETNIKKIHIASCILKEAPFPKCLHKKDIIDSIKKLGFEIVLGSDNKWELELKSKKDNKDVYTDADPILNGSDHW